jgi:hypothetical protein
MDGEIDVPEVSASEIPVACRIVSNYLRGEFRYHEGRFLKACAPVDGLGLSLAGVGNDRLSFSRTAGVQHMMAYELANRWFHHEPLLKEPIWPTEQRQDIEYNETVMRSGWFTPETVNRSALPNDRFRLADLSSPWQEDIEFHEQRASRLAEGVLCIDGTLWKTVEEPLLFMEPVSGDPFSLMDMEWIRKSSGWSIFQPKVYGGSENRPAMKDGGDLGYWNWKAFTLPVTEHERVSEIFALMRKEGSLQKGLATPRVDVFMPDVFGHDLAELELVRVARAMCVHLSFLLECGFNVDGLAKLVDRIVDLTGGVIGVTDGAELESRLEELRVLVAASMLYVEKFPDGYSNIMRAEDIPARIDVLLENFANRPMKMPETNAGPARTGPAL